MPSAKQRQEIARFLKARRERIRPEDVGLPAGGRRRTPGLRREEVAFLAGISAEWYKWLEQARDVRASAQTLERIAAVLRLEPAEARHLLLLSGHAVPGAADQRIETNGVHKNLQRLLDQLDPCPAYIHGQRWDLLAWNRATSTVLGDFTALEPAERNCLRMSLLGPLRAMIPDWESHAMGLVHHFRADYAHHVGDPWFEDFIAELRRESAEFAQWWEEPVVKDWRDGIKLFNHPDLGQLAFEHSAFALADERLSGLRLVTLMPVDGTGTRKRLEQALNETPAVTA